MTEAAAIVCWTGAACCIGYAFWRAGTAAPQGDTDRIAALAVALLLFLLGSAVAVIDAKVADASAQAPAKKQAPPAAAQPDWMTRELGNFRRHPRLLSGPLQKQLCLVRYYERRPGKRPGANWWTTCSYHRKLDDLPEVREKLALLVDWGSYDTRVTARIPKGEEVVFLRGRAAKQCEPAGAPCYAGGGTQLLFEDREFDRGWFVAHRCVPPGHTAPRTRAYAPCAG